MSYTSFAFFMFLAAVAAVLALGFALGWRYRLEGPQLGEEHLREQFARLWNWLRRRGGE